MITTIPITKARINLGSVVRKAKLNNEYFILEKDGYPVAGIMNIDEFEDYLDTRNPDTKKNIRKSFLEYKSKNARPVKNFLKELKK